MFMKCFDTINFHLDIACPIKEVRVNSYKQTHRSWIVRGISVSREKLEYLSEIQKLRLTQDSINILNIQNTK